MKFGSLIVAFAFTATLFNAGYPTNAHAQETTATVKKKKAAKKAASPAETAAARTAPPFIAKKRDSHARFNIRHEQNLERIKQGPIDLLFLGDSITDRWSSSPLVWDKYFGKFNPANFGVGGDRTENVLWRIENGELAGFSPKVVVLMIGTNNTHTNQPDEIVKGIGAIIKTVQQKAPQAKILLHAIFPREARMKNGKPAMEPVEKVKEVNKHLPALAKEMGVEYLDISDKFLTDGHVPKAIMPDGVHLNEAGYEIWGKAVEPAIARMMEGESSAKDKN